MVASAIPSTLFFLYPLIKTNGAYAEPNQHKPRFGAVIIKPENCLLLRRPQVFLEPVTRQNLIIQELYDVRIVRVVSVTVIGL